ncbi:unnamed protein product [Diplocarpon coronariae]
MASAGQRLNSVLGHLSPEIGDDEFQVITYAARTPLTKAKKGGLKDTPIDDLLISLLTTVREQSNVDPSLIEDICMGNVLAPAQGYIIRAAVLAAGYPVTAAASVANRFCSSGLLAIQQISNQIISGSIDIGLAVGAESMSTCPDGGFPDWASTKITGHEIAGQNVMPMGQTSENVAGDFGISREQMDRFAAHSFQKAEKAQREGWTRDEIVPVTASFTDPTTGTTSEKIVSADDGVRAGTTAASLGKIRAAFPQWSPSHTTGGNASQITDGAAAVLLMKRSRAHQLGLRILGKYVQATVVGLAPRIMGIGPAYAIPKVLAQVGLAKDDVDVFEINEAFASMVSRDSLGGKTGSLMCAGCVLCGETRPGPGESQPERRRHVSADPLPPSPGHLESARAAGRLLTVISALGHPLGCTGTRQVVTALSELRRQDRRIAVTSMCVGTVRAISPGPSCFDREQR